MILKVDDTYHSKVMSYLKKEPDFNLFRIGDIERYGYDNYFLDIWAGIDRKVRIEGILLRYFEYLIFYSQGNFNVEEFSKLINSLNYLEISGKLELLQKLELKLDIKPKRIVNFCVLDTSSKLEENGINIRPKKIRFGNINKIAKLYEDIDEFENTTVENIKNGLRTGRGYCIEINKKVVAMAKSTLETKTHAMLVGVGTHPDFRNRGLATKCIVKICKDIINENKIPCLFYDNIEAGKIYNKLGFKEKGYWAIYGR
jgi:predicted GNAT family acetyltransferase